MKIEAFLESHLVLYYFLLILIMGLSILFNKPKEERIYQTKVAKYYLLFTFISTVILFAEYALKDLPMSFFSQNTVFIYLIILLIEVCARFYQGITLFAIGIGTVIKIFQKLKGNKRDSKLSKLDNYMGYKPSYATNNSDTTEKGEKKNFLMKIFYDENKVIKESGCLISKIAQIISIALIIVYITMPIFWHFDIKMLFSIVSMLLIIVTLMELHYALQGTKPVAKKKEDSKKPLELNALKVSLQNVLRLKETETPNLNEKMVGKKNVIMNSPSALICEVPNSNELKDINIKVMNSAFFENKKVLVVCLDDKKAKEYHSRLNVFNKEYDGKLILKLISSNDKLFDSSVEIYVTAIENCFGNIKLLSEIDTIIIEDYDEILLNKLELLRALGSIVKMGNPKMDYVILTYMLQGIEATIKSLLYVNEISCYYTENKQQAGNVELNVWEKNDNFITEKMFGKATKNLGSIVPLSLLSVKWEPDRILLISKNEPLNFELNELNAMRNLYEKSFSNSELKLLGEKSVTSLNEKYFDYSKKNWIIVDDKSNLYEKIYKISLINGVENKLNIVSEQYLLRDYMISTYKENKARLKSFLPYVPYEVNSGKVVLYNLLLQLTNFGVKENIIANILNENGISIKLGKGNNTRLIADKLNYFVKQEFNLDVDIYSYITLQEIKEKYIFDMTKKKYIEVEKIYILDEQALRLFPNEIFSRVSFVKDGFALDIEKEYAYNFYQKYLPGQKHFLNGYVYEIKNIMETENGANAILEASTNYDNNTYRQDRKVEYLDNFVIKESKTNKYTNLVLKYQMGKIDYQIKTEGYFEFKNGISKIPGAYRYVSLDENNILKTIRNHTNADALKLEFLIPKAEKVDEVAHRILNEELGQIIAFLISEVLESLLGENSKYIQVKSLKAKRDSSIFRETWVSPIEIPNYECNNIEIFILEDTQIERGLIDMIYKNLDNIFNIIHEYLSWVFLPSANVEEERDRFIRNIEKTDSQIEKYKKVLYIIGDSIM